MVAPSRTWMWASLALTLVLGMSLGVVLDRTVLNRSGLFWRGGDSLGGPGRAGDERGRRQAGRFLAALSRELDLSEAQKSELEKLLEANREKAHSFWEEARRSYAELRKRFRAEIRALLTPEQQERFDDWLAREDAKRGHRERPLDAR